MKKIHKVWGLGAAALVLVGGSVLATTSFTAKASSASPNACTQQVRQGHFAGIVAPKGNCSSTRTAAQQAAGKSDAAKGTPPLLFHGGAVMMTPSTSPLTITPIYWDPAGHLMPFTYSNLINTYITSVQRASGQNSNVFSVADEYSGTNGQINYNIRMGAPLNDHDALPASGCQVASTDTANIYADGSGYDWCLDDAQLQAEIDHVTAVNGYPHNLSNIYVLFLPKHVESCFNPGPTNTSANQCTINYQPSAAFCAYHSEDASGAVYANMPFPIYESKTGFTCGNEFNFGSLQSPNNNPDGDVEISPTSHEVNEAITDPDTSTGWYDSSGFENGDECAYVYGGTSGFNGGLYNQTISGRHFLTQEEFSNQDFAITGGGCVQSASAEA